RASTFFCHSSFVIRHLPVSVLPDSWHELHCPSQPRSGDRRVDFALSAETERLAHGAARRAGTLRLYLPRRDRMDCPEIGFATDQQLRTGDVLLHVSSGARGPVSDQSLPHVELCARRFPQIARIFLPEAWARPERA